MMNEAVSDLTALQSANVLKISRNITRITDDDQGIKALLAASNDKCFSLTSNPHIRQNRDKWYIYINRRRNKNSLKGKRINSTAFRTRTGAESELFEFRKSKESKESKTMIIERPSNRERSESYCKRNTCFQE